MECITIRFCITNEHYFIISVLPSISISNCMSSFSSFFSPALVCFFVPSLKRSLVYICISLSVFRFENIVTKSNKNAGYLWIHQQLFYVVLGYIHILPKMTEPYQNVVFTNMLLWLRVRDLTIFHNILVTVYIVSVCSVSCWALLLKSEVSIVCYSGA